MFGSKKDDGEKTLYCSFCGKSQHKVAKLIAGPTVFICDECTELCWDIIKDEHKADLFKAQSDQVTPLHVANLLESSLAGHLRAKYIVSLAILDRLTGESKGLADVDWSPHRILLVGPIGCGKRLLVQAVAQALEIPFAASNEQELEERPAAEIWERIALTLLADSDSNAEKAAKGVVYLEINGALPGSFAEFCNHRLITVSDLGTGLEGEIAPRLDLSHVLIIVGGPFLGLASTSGPVSRDDVARLGSNLDGKACRELAQSLRSVSPEALVEYGFPKGLVEQIPYVAAMRDLYDGECEETLGA